MTIGEKIRQRRAVMGLSAEEIAAKCGVAPATIYRIESGEIQSSRTSTLKSIAEVLEMDLDDLLSPADKEPRTAVQMSIPNPWGCVDRVTVVNDRFGDMIAAIVADAGGIHVTTASSDITVILTSMMDLPQDAAALS